MRKTIALFMTFMLSLGMLAGCGSKAEAPSVNSVTMENGKTVQSVVDQISEDVGMQMPADIDDSVLKDIFYIDPSTDIEEYYGKMAMTITSADNIVAVKAKPDKKQVVVDGLNKRLEDVRASFAQYLPDQSEKAKKGQVIEKGDYVFLLILGQDVENFEDDMAKAVKYIDEAF
ncbi:DUF4358 domain-containing protein [Oscillospiraceae bacterium PP1C4]